MKKVIITGASSGLGKEIGLILKEDYEVINISRNSSEFTDIKCDLSNDKDISKAINEIKERHSDFSYIILNSGIMNKALVGEINSDIDKEFKINTTSNIKIINSLLNTIKTNEADVVIIGSKGSFDPKEGTSVYTSTKHAINGFIKSLQLELKNDKSRVIGIHPGSFDSNLRKSDDTKKRMDPKYIADLIKNFIELPKNMEVSEIVINLKK